ncbi:zinc-binding oxidoreductase CipB [Aspergillus welwitschiae]|uniref:Zinc-binding oxidoreductase CipB n=1 Tax=Aspergillus welwitschiae TaxID=1341132 RepID=A0A3F3PQ33_9EURO|nr:zinc-binding oxidoreductase CipB [Aspergillus welwitschiae]RDH29045.1 zinc-binding oxidoreductase CipB [Aspergillus welwitschiae]
MSQNRAAWIIAARTKPFTIGEAPLYKPGKGEILIRNHAVAVVSDRFNMPFNPIGFQLTSSDLCKNPVDWKIQESGLYLNTFPFILGRDAAGIVVDIGEGVTQFHRGQRVIAHLHSPKSGNSAHAAYQLFSLASQTLAAPIPFHISFEQGAVLPLAISTSAAGLYLPEYLNLPLPSDTPESLGKTLLVWGGASSVGATVIQLATASGLHVVTTASHANYEFVRSLGAADAFDYQSPTVVMDIVTRLRHMDLCGVYDAISEDKSFTRLAAIAERLQKRIPAVSVHPCYTPTVFFHPKYVTSYGISYPPNGRIGEAIWGAFVPHALATRQLKAKPDPVVVGHGLENIQNGLDAQKAGVSAKKIVITL